ncbi:oligopeptide ABC transpoter oligopeptide-binding protein [Pseudoroseomonas deserti]|uniref:Oligopeptide ABC transpoter oligopeptide-binding protein n=1 Tax=Teichococcus deserti TaxID=1817963 RepID=A0A1V2H2T9_9PROT|nr:ABC transporter substrate-binding protein [Pseudoroseomonas deserti]ONG53325.1 oligopeptide ABC transpoter oligopeptide-binding protein [Pseudoroseomonas deserti]
MLSAPRIGRRPLAAALLAGAAFAGPARAAATPGKLTVAISGFPPGVEPVLFNHTATRRVVPQLFDTLIAFDHAKDMALRPALAERWERRDARALRLHLRRGVTFHDGSPFTARDVAFSLGPDHLLGPGRSGRSVAMQTLERLARVEVEDDHTVTIHAKGDDALLEQRLAAWASEIVSQRGFEAAGGWDRWAAAPIGTGPYRLVGQKLDVNVQMAAHADYWGGRPPFASIEYRIVPEVASRVAGLRSGEYDIVTDLPPDLFPEIDRQPGLQVVGGQVQNIRYLAIDATGPVLGDAGIRRALSLALDRKLFLEALWGNRVAAPNGFQFSSFGRGYIEDFPALAYDPAQARALVKAAGYAGQTISYKLLNNYYTNQVAGAQTMVEMWREVGLNVRIEMLENFSQVQKMPINGIYDSSSTAIFLDQLGHAWREFGPNGTLPKLVGIPTNAEYQALGGRLQDVYEAEERRRIIRRMLTILHDEDPPCVVLHASGQFYGKRRDVAWTPGQTLDLNFGPSNPAYAL